MISSRPLLLLLATLTVSQLATAPAAAGEPPGIDKATTIIVITTGSGKDENTALRQAYSNAVQQAIGTIVDAETVVENDTVIKDQILTASNAIVEGYEPVGKPQVADGVVTVKIKARVLRKQLTEELASANVVRKAVEGKDAFAEVVTELQREKDAAAIVSRIFQDFPANVVKAEPVGQLRVVEKAATDAVVGVPIRLSIGMKKYSQWHEAFVPMLSKLAVQSKSSRWNPQQQRVQAAAVPLGMPSKGQVSLPPDDLRAGYNVLSARWQVEEVQDGGKLVIFERQGSSKFTSLVFDAATFDAIIGASANVTRFEVLLLDDAGKEVDGLEQRDGFINNEGPNYEFYVSPFWELSMGMRHAGRGWPQGGVGRTVPAAIFPYCGTESAAVPGFVYEFRFKLSLDDLARVKSVEAKVSSHRPASK